MLEITVPPGELFDENTQEFSTTKGATLQLEHSLVSLSKWESKWCKPFFSKKEKTIEETLDYVRCMTLTKNVDLNVYRFLSGDNIKKINEYIDAPMTATTIHDRGPHGGSGEQITAEILYYYMIQFNIPFECQKWHLNRLMTLIKVCNVKNQPGKKMGKGEILRSNAALNAARRKKLHTKG